jgi:hypothetical protein
MCYLPVSHLEATLVIKLPAMISQCWCLSNLSSIASDPKVQEYDSGNSDTTPQKSCQVFPVSRKVEVLNLIRKIIIS